MQVGEMIMERVRHPKKWLVRVSLWMLSTWYGTYILCGNESLSNHFPYFKRFSKVSQKKREQIALSWSLSYFFLLRMFFRTIKILCLLAFFTQVSSFFSFLEINTYRLQFIQSFLNIFNYNSNQ